MSVPASDINSVRVDLNDGVTRAVVSDSRYKTGLVGSVYVFDQIEGVWQQPFELPPAGGDLPTAAEQYGRGLAIHSDGETIVVGAPGETDLTDVQDVYTYIHQGGGTWTQFGGPLTRDPDPGVDPSSTGFGYALAIQDDTLVVGAPGEAVDSGVDSHGAVYVFERDRMCNPAGAAG